MCLSNNGNLSNSFTSQWIKWENFHLWFCLDDTCVEYLLWLHGSDDIQFMMGSSSHLFTWCPVAEHLVFTQHSSKSEAVSKDNYLHRKAQICFKSRDLLARSSILHPCLLYTHCRWICWVTRPRWWSSRLWSWNCCRACSRSGSHSELAALWGIPCTELGAYTNVVYVTSNFFKHHTLSIVPLFSWRMVQDSATYLSPFSRLQNPQKSHGGGAPLNFCGIYAPLSCLHNFFLYQGIWFLLSAP